MTNRNQHVSGDNLTSETETDYFGLLCVDLVIKILSKLPVKSIAKCRCVSKQWSSIIRHPNFHQLFPVKSQASPQLLFGLKFGSDLFFYSSPQPQNPDDNSSVVATRHHTNLGTDFHRLCRPVCGLVCSQHIGKKDSWAVISNPITGETVTTPKVRIYGTEARAEYSFGYDPIEKQFKVLRITWLSSKSDNWFGKFHVLTLGTGDGNLLWREIQCYTPHYPINDDNWICINGFLYYLATINNKKHTIVCFDVRSEKLGFINIDQELARKMYRPYLLIDYKGKLGFSYCNMPFSHFELWVLEDVQEHKWSKHNYRVQHPWLEETSFVRVAGMIDDSGEIVLCYTSNPLSIYYYNLEKNIITRVEVPVFEEFNYCRVYTFPNFVEDVKLM